VNRSEHSTRSRTRDDDRLYERQVEDVIDAYWEWRAECRRVRDAYARWSAARGVDAGLAFAACLSALDREQSSATRLEATADRWVGVVAQLPFRELRSSR
jgi:hypothetical protein